jgi:hypothetical protein
MPSRLELSLTTHTASLITKYIYMICFSVLLRCNMQAETVPQLKMQDICTWIGTTVSHLTPDSLTHSASLITEYIYMICFSVLLRCNMQAETVPQLKMQDICTCIGTTVSHLTLEYFRFLIAATLRGPFHPITAIIFDAGHFASNLSISSMGSTSHYNSGDLLNGYPG